MRSRPLDSVSLVAGIGVGLLALLLALDQLEALDLGFGWLGAAVAAVTGATLLASGLAERER